MSSKLRHDPERKASVVAAEACRRRVRSTLTIAVLFSIGTLFACTGAPASTSPASTDTPTASATVAPQPSATPSPTQTTTLTLTPTSIPSGRVLLAAVGDIMLGRSVAEAILTDGPQTVFAGVQSVLDSADLRVGNLECALADAGTPEPKKTYTLQAPPAAAASLQLGKFDLLSLANNHAMDYGYKGLEQAQETLRQAGIETVGAGGDYAQAHAPVIFERNGLRLAFLAYLDVPEERDGFDAHAWIATEDGPGIAWANPGEIAADVAAAKAQADVVIVLLHSGTEIGEYMSVLSGSQLVASHAAIDAGAALVLGSHPHQLESIESYHGGLIAFSLGNFVFDEYRGIANASIILQVNLDRNGVQSYTYAPVRLDKGLPQLISAEQIPAIATLVAP